MTTSEPAAPVDFVPGDATGLSMPAHADALMAAGADFLTEAFHAFGSLAPHNRVTRITSFEPFPGGNSGHKLRMSVDYEHAAPGLHTDLFVKFSRDFLDAFRDRRRYELEAEVRLAALSRLPAFPVEVAAAYFADFNSESGTGVLITQQIAFGVGGLEPLRRKCMDHELADPLAYYRATVTALARLVAAHKSGRLSPELESLFPFDLETALADNPIPWTELQVRERVGRYAEFAKTCPQLLPAEVTTPAFIARFEREAVRALHHEAAIRRYLLADPAFVALCHWNTNIDNAWFWRDATGTLQCGLLDWGMVRQMNVGTALWGGLCGANADIWDDHLVELLALFSATIEANGGPRLPVDTLKRHLDLSVALLGLSLMFDVPTLVLSRLPEAASASGPLDPILDRDPVVRGFLHVYTVFLNLWRTHDMAAAVDHVVAWSKAQDSA